MSTPIDVNLLLVPLEVAGKGRDTCPSFDGSPESYACTRWSHPDNPLHVAHAFDHLIPVRAWVDAPSELAVYDFKDRESLIDLAFLIEPALAIISCGMVSPGRVPFLCTRPHHDDGMHIAASNVAIHSVWVSA